MSIVSAALLLTAMQASAAMVTSIHTGQGSGTLDGVAFENAYFAITAIADTSTIVSCGDACLSNDNISATIYIQEVGIFTFITPTRYFVNELIGFSRAGDAGDLFNGPLGSWDMASALEPVIGTGQLFQWLDSDVLTTGGVLVFNEGVTPSAFTAAVSEVPLPAGMWLLGSGLIGLVGVARRQA